MTNVLLISANQDFVEDLKGQIACHAPGFKVIDDGANEMPDIVVVDEDLEVLKTYSRRGFQIPFFYITAQPEELPRELPVNHLVVKPFSLDYFLDELQSSLNLYENSENGYIIFNRYIVRPIKKDILNLRNSQLIKLTEKEVAILKYLYKFRDRLVDKKDLLQNVWGYAPEVTTHTIETHVYRLRQKVESDAAEDQLILTLDGGYRLKV